MKTLLALVAVCVATVGAQHIWPYGVPGILPQVAPVVAVKEPSTVVVKSLVESPVQVKGLFGVPVYPQYPHVVQVAIPSQDTARGMPQPVEDTPEVKSAKALFAKEYEKAAIAAALAPEVRKRRDLTSEMKIETTPADTMRLRTPMQYPWPIVSHHMTAPWQLGMYGHPGMPLITTSGM